MSKWPSDFKVKLSFKEDIEPHEILLDSLARKREEEVGFAERKFEIPLFKRVIEGLLFFCLFVLLALFAKTFQIQVVGGKELADQAENNKFIFRQLQAERGVIYDRNLNQLVFNLPSFDLIYDGRAGNEDVLKEVADILKKNPKDIKEGTVAENLDQETLIILETKINELTGFKIQNNTTRQYVDGENYSQVLGYTTRADQAGKAGLEAAYDDFLKKNLGMVRVERDARGNIISKLTVNSPQPGNSLVLWLDSNLQKKLEVSLQKELAAVGSSRGVAVAMDPKTGGILALVSLPSFDNNVFSQGDQAGIQKVLNDSRAPLFNRVISGQYPTGSTIKPLIASAALQEKIISPEKKINDTGLLEIKSKYDPDISWTFTGIIPHGWVDMKDALAVSSNIYFYTIGGGFGDQRGLGPSKIKKYLELFGWGSATNIDLPGEASGFIPSPEWKQRVKKEGWWDGDTYHLSIGQGDLLATPIQVATAISAIANGGKLLQPQAVKEVIDGDKKVVEEFGPKVVRDSFIDPQNLQVVREGMRQGVTAGSSVLLASLPVPAASKTGTAETTKKDYYNNWVNVFAPYDDPQIVLMVMIEGVKGMQSVALPVAQEVLNWYFSKEPR